MSSGSVLRILALLCLPGTTLVAGCGDDDSVTRTPVNTPPTACFIVSPDTGTVATDFRFDASCSTDGQDATAQLQVRWDLESDGVWDVDWSTVKTLTRRFAAIGARTVALEVKDSAGLAASTSRQILAANTAPTASFIVEPESGTTATVFSFDASGSSDLEEPGTALRVRWDWESDGTWDTGYSTAKTASHIFAAPGTMVVALEVTDPEGLTGTTTRSVTVSDRYLPPTSPANVLANLQAAYADRNIGQYRKLFTEDFTFVFNPLDPEDPDHPTPASWGLVDELEATQNMFEDELVHEVELTGYRMGVPQAADSVFYGPHAWKVRVDETNLQVATRTPDGDLLTLVVQGTTEMFFFREDPTRPIDGHPTWFIFRWEDQPIGSVKTESKSWGQLKALFR